MAGLSLRLTKGLVLGGMFLITSIFCLLPAWLISSVRSHHLESGPHSRLFRYGISFLNCFACGVFLGTLFLDLQPDVIDAFKEHLPKVGIHTEYPLAQFCIVFGLLLVMMVERIVVSCKTEDVHIFHGHDHGHGRGRVDAERQEARERGRLRHRTVSESELLREQINQRYAMPNPYHPPAHQEPPSNDDRGDFRTRRSSEISLPDAVDNEPEILSSVASSRSSSPTREDGHGHSQGSVEPALRLVKSKSHQTTHTARSFILLVALSLHSVFEGLAVGLQGSRQKVVEIFGALLIHKCVVAFSVGMNLMQSRMAFRNVIMLALVFAAASPLGIGIAMGMENFNQDGAAGIISAVLQAMACGTFLFITFLEVLPHEMLKNSQDEAGGVMLLKILCMVIGFSVMAGLMFMDA
ncbi:zinc transporter ZIP1-like [Paramacrobiotus metropolitanus]|uniref:zinc transporter ZIP1-like n=1 Tax=Paramacrobiotus metropolitanus TaxID=2943436 RepID=UPI002446553C|nr:zinc transporter ZIP1-like [Paramacrobiotus metropolitanus]